MNFKVNPHKGINDILFGLPRKDVHKLLGNPEYSSEIQSTEFDDLLIVEPAKDGYHQNDLLIFYDEESKVEFIQISRNEDNIYVSLFGIEVFKTPAEKLIAEVINLTKYQYDKTDPEVPYSFIFKDIDLAFWREEIPDENEDHVGEYFLTISIGRKNYYN